MGAMALLVLSGFAASTASAAGPGWKVNGSTLKVGQKSPIKLTAGATELKGKAVGVEVVINCGSSTVQNAYIEGNGTGAGQDGAKAIVYEKCTVKNAGCKVAEPITTSQIKSHLVRYEEKKIGNLIEPTQGELFVEVKIESKTGEKCSIANTYPIKGATVAEVKPEGVEAVVGELSFPTAAITKVKLEGTERTVGLKLGTEAAAFSGKYEAQLESGLKYGAF
jgi:hypothetical protein